MAGPSSLFGGGLLRCRAESDDLCSLPANVVVCWKSATGEEMGQRPGIQYIRSSQGFSILEVLAVLFVIGMFATLLVSRLVDTSAELAAESEMVKAHLRFAQSRAMNAEVSWGIRFDGASYTLLTDGLTSSGFLPNESSPSHTLAVGTIAASVNPVLFDQWGSPGNVDITVTVADASGARSFVIGRNTGFMP